MSKETFVSSMRFLRFSRLWVKDTYTSRVAAGEQPEMLDKEIVRRFLLDGVFLVKDVPEVPAEVLVSLSKVYLKVAETLIGKPLNTGLKPSEVSI